MENKHKLLLLIAAVLIIAVAAVVPVGLVNGSWPWNADGWFNGDSQSTPGKDTTVETTGDTTQGTGGNGAQLPAQTEEGDIVINLDDLTKPTTGDSKPAEGTTGNSKPTEGTTGNTQNTENTESTQDTEGTTAPTGNQNDQGGGAKPEEDDIVINFIDLIAAENEK